MMGTKRNEYGEPEVQNPKPQTLNHSPLTRGKFVTEGRTAGPGREAKGIMAMLEYLKLRGFY